MISLLDDRLSDAITSVLVHSLWQTTAIVLLCALILRAIPSRASHLRYSVSLFSLLLAISAPIVTVVVFEEVLRVVSFVSSDRPELSSAGVLRSEMRPLGPETAVGLEPSRGEDAKRSNSIAPGVFADLWAIGVVLLLLRLTWALARIESLSRHGHRPLPEFHAELVQDVRRRLRTALPVDAVLSSRVHVPTVIGWLRPRILIPSSALFGLTPSQFEAVLAHEMAHIRRWDYLVNLMQSLLETLFFFHPAVWWLSQRVRIERECCCDDIAMQLCGRTCTMRALANLEALRHNPLSGAITPGPALAADGGRLLERIQRMATPDATPTRASTSLSLVVTLFALFALIGAAVSLHASPDPSDPVADLLNALEAEASVELSAEEESLGLTAEETEPELTESPDDTHSLVLPRDIHLDPVVGIDPEISIGLAERTLAPTSTEPKTLIVLATKENSIILNRGEKDGVQVGNEFAVHRAGILISKVVVSSVQDHLSSAKVVLRLQPVRPGDRVVAIASLPIEPIVADPTKAMDPLKSTLQLSGASVHAAPSRLVILEVREADGLVVLNGGADDGVRAGDKFHVSRGSRWIGTVEVVRSADDLAGARIQLAASPIRVGDRVQPIRATLEPVEQVSIATEEVSVDAVGPRSRFVILKAESASFAIGQRWWIEEGAVSTGYVEVVEAEGRTATARVRLVSPDRSIEVGSRARLDRGADRSM